MSTLTIAAIQLTSTPRIADNIATMQKLVAQAAAQDANWVLLPEYWAIMGLRDSDKLAHAEPYSAGILQTALGEAAQQHQTHLFGGTTPLASPTPHKVHNSLLVYSSSGECLSRYDKIHLFNYQTASERYCESDTLMAGEQIPQLCINGWRIAQGICYDLRFPELFRAQAPADIIMLPAAFTHTTGKAHWELLLRARAVENQCYLVAAAQTGTHENGRRTFGHSMIVDPWGDIIAMQPENEGIAIATIDSERLREIRTRLPVLQHRVL